MEMDPPPPLHADRLRRCSEYLLALEEERRKIQVFQRELPLCLDLVTQTIEGMRNHMDSIVGGSAETVSDHGGPVLEEFMPLKPTLSSSSSEDDGEEHDSSHHQRSAGTADDGVDADKSDEAAPGDPETAAARASSGRRRLPQPETKKAMPDWLQSVQLWSNHQDELLLPCRPVALSACRKPGGAFQPFEKDKDKKEKPKPKQRTEMPLPASSSATAAASSAVVGDSCDRAGGATDNDTAGNTNKASIKGGGKDKEAQSASQAPGRKPRRCWAPEFHRRFLQALQQLGGSHAATPKQIRELMKVDGLTNDEVKSHLQKYRLHTRRPNSTAVAVQNSGTSVTPPAAPQFVVVGGIWVPPPEYAAAAAAAAAAVAAAAAQPQQVHDLPGDASGTTTTTAS